MKTTLTLAGAALLLVGCHDHRDHTDSPPSSWYLVYGNGHPIAASPTEGWMLDEETHLLDHINAHRVSIGLNALIDHGVMRDLARAHSIHMAVHGFESSLNPEGDDPGDRADIAGLFWSAYAENVVYGENDAHDAFDAMLASPGMHAVIDDPFWVYAGAGYEHDASSWWDDYWTVDFREP